MLLQANHSLKEELAVMKTETTAAKQAAAKADAEVERLWTMIPLQPGRQPTSVNN